MRPHVHLHLTFSQSERQGLKKIKYVHKLLQINPTVTLQQPQGGLEAYPTQRPALSWFQRGGHASCDPSSRTLLRLAASSDGHEVPSHAALAVGAYMYI